MTDLHPNPQAKREHVLLLDGQWDFCFDSGDVGLQSQYHIGTNWGSPLTITVPYVYQSPRSGIGSQEDCPVIWYRRHFSLDKAWEKEKNLLHIDACDFKCTVFVNGHAVGSHEGGYAPITFDISAYAKAGDNLLVVRVEDHSSPRYPLGKQSPVNKNFACWYTQNTGIWQSVWLESVPKTYIKDFRFIPHLPLGEVEVIAEISGPDAEGAVLSLALVGQTNEDSYPKKISRQLSATAHNNVVRFRFSIHDIGFEIPFWSPERPNLSTVHLELKTPTSTDRVESYFGYRNVSIEGDRFYLNGRPYYQKLILNQGYYGEGLLTGSEEEYLNDISLTKAMGFNGIRVHQKTESARFLYLCDREGLLYWAEMASPYSHDGFAVPLVLEEIKDLVLKHANHPCVVAWTPFNESWGIPDVMYNERQQQLTLAAREVILSLDEQRRPVISNDGWEHTVSDILTIHDYEQDANVIAESYPYFAEDFNFDSPPTQVRKPFYAKGYHYSGEPIYISEYGGIAYRSSAYGDKDWGYGSAAQSPEEFFQRFEDLHDAFFDMPYVSGLCYTQLTDVQQEINGLLDHNHKPKFDVERIAEILNKKRTI
ncbi:MAG: glycoside hydrolase family 2 protein [Brevinema sp.]